MYKLYPIFFFVLFVFTTSHAGDLIHENENGEFSAFLDHIKLSELQTFLKKRCGIEFKGHSKLLETPITVSFEKVAMEQMLKKILRRMNFVFMYNNQGKISEVTLLQTGNNEAISVNNERIVKHEGDGMAPYAAQGSNNTNSDEITSFKVVHNATPPENEHVNGKVKTSDNVASFKVVQNTLPPGSEHANSEIKASDDITSFKIVSNFPPPGTK